MQNICHCLVDTSFLIHQYTHTFKDMRVQFGETEFLTGAYYGVLNFAVQVYQAFPSVTLHFCYDEQSDYRKKLFSGYKAQREHKPEFQEITLQLQQLLALLPFVRQYRLLGHEADDLLASLFFTLHTPSKTVVFTGDHDFLQLVPFGAQITRQRRNKKFIILGEEYIQEKFDVSGVDLLRYRGFLGDKSDNIPSVYPRLPRKMLREFVKNWRCERSYIQALEVTPMSDLWKTRFQDVKFQKDLQRNLKLMDLQKYKKKPLELSPQHFVKNPALIKQYELYEFERFLQWYEQKKSTEPF